MAFFPSAPAPSPSPSPQSGIGLRLLTKEEITIAQKVQDKFVAAYGTDGTGVVGAGCHGSFVTMDIMKEFVPWAKSMFGELLSPEGRTMDPRDHEDRDGHPRDWADLVDPTVHYAR